MTDGIDAKVVRNQAATDELFLLDLEVGPLASTYRQPGQFVKLQEGIHQEGFFAIASAPDASGHTLEFLIKRGSPLADALAALPIGGAVRVSPIQGKGFPVEQARGKSVMLFATGSGISAMRALIDTLRKDRAAYGSIWLYFGVRTPDAFAYRTELDAWRRDGIQVHQTVSNPGNSGWQGLTGYVQQHVPRAPVANTVAFLCGVKGMVQGVSELLEQQGLTRDHIFLNF